MRFVLLILAAIFLGGPHWAAAQDQLTAQQTEPKTIEFSRPVEVLSFSAKMICGRQSARDDLSLADGLYATTVNVRNPHEVDMIFEKSLALVQPPGQQTAGQTIPLAAGLLGPGEALAVDCGDLATTVFSYGFPAPFIEGFLAIESPQDLDVVVVTTFAAAGGADRRGARLASIDVEHVRGRRIPARMPPPTRLPPAGGDVTREEALCGALSQTAAIVEGTVDQLTYIYEEAPGEGPRQVIRLGDVKVHAGGGGVLQQPIELLLLGGFLPNGDSLSVSHIPILSVGKRYVLLLRNTYWRLSPILFNFYFRKEIVNAKPVLIDREGYAVSNLFSGRLRQRLYEAENSGEPPAQIAGDPGNLEQALAADQFVDDLIAFSQSCHESVLVGAFAPYPIVPWDVIRGSPPQPGLTSP